MDQFVNPKDVIHFYRVNNLDNVRYFYESILHWTPFLDQGSCLIYEVDSVGKIGFCLHHPKNTNDNTCISLIYSFKEEVDSMYHYLVKKGLTPKVPKLNEKFKIYHFFISDMEGILLEFQVFLD